MQKASRREAARAERGRKIRQAQARKARAARIKRDQTERQYREALRLREDAEYLARPTGFSQTKATPVPPPGDTMT